MNTVTGLKYKVKLVVLKKIFTLDICFQQEIQQMNEGVDKEIFKKPIKKHFLENLI